MFDEIGALPTSDVCTYAFLPPSHNSHLPTSSLLRFHLVSQFRFPTFGFIKLQSCYTLYQRGHCKSLAAAEQKEWIACINHEGRASSMILVCQTVEKDRKIVGARIYDTQIFNQRCIVPLNSSYPTPELNISGILHGSLNGNILTNCDIFSVIL